MAGEQRLWRWIVFAALGLGLLWSIVIHSFVATRASENPWGALALRADDTASLVTLIDRTVRASRTLSPAAETETASADGVSDPKDRKNELGRLASAILILEPGNARALTVIGNLKREAGEVNAAAALYHSAARRSLREPTAIGWSIQEALVEQDWSLVMQRADTMMRMHMQTIESLAPLVAQMLEKPGLGREVPAMVYDALARAPPWRDRFLRQLLSVMTDARTPLRLFVALQTTEYPPTADELRTYVDFLVEKGFYDLAYYTWLQFLPPERLAGVNLLSNGSFENRPTGVPFDWKLPIKGTAAVSIARRVDRPLARALVINLGHGRVELGRISQLVRLPPGRYRVTGEAMGEVHGARGLRWHIACARGQHSMQPLGESEMLIGNIEAWKAFSFPVTVPKTGCAAQWLWLYLDARTPSERLVSGTIWFDELDIREEPDAPAPQTRH